MASFPIQKNQKTAPSFRQSKQMENDECSIIEMIFAREALPLGSILSFVGKDQYRFLAANKLWRQMYTQKYGFSASLLQVAISSSRATIFLKEAAAHDEKQRQELCKIAAGLGKISVLTMLKDYFSIDISKAAAKKGQLKALQWLRRHSCPWNVWTCAYAAKGGHLDVLQWARKQNCPWNREKCRASAREGQFLNEGPHLHEVKWILLQED